MTEHVKNNRGTPDVALLEKQWPVETIIEGGPILYSDIAEIIGAEVGSSRWQDCFFGWRAFLRGHGVYLWRHTDACVPVATRGPG
jgi:hypothetical protein